MKRKNKKLRAPADASADLVSRLLAYSTAAGVTLAIAPDAHGAIVTTPANLTLSATHNYFLDITGGTNASDPKFEFVVKANQWGPSGHNKGHSTTFNIKANGNGVAGSGASAKNLSSDAAVGASQPWSLSNNSLLLAKFRQTSQVNTNRNYVGTHWVEGNPITTTTTHWNSTNSTYSTNTHTTTTGGHPTSDFVTVTTTMPGPISSSGPLANNVRGIIGVRFEFAGNTHFGWINFIPNSGAQHATITKFAYETVPNLAIAPGRTNYLSNAQNLTFEGVGATQMSLNWVPGDGERYIVVAHPDTAVSWAPADGTEYTPNSDFAQATDEGAGNRIVYAGSGTNVTVTALDPDRLYHFKIFACGGTNASAIYLKTGNAVNSQQTLSIAPGIFFR